MRVMLPAIIAAAMAVAAPAFGASQAEWAACKSARNPQANIAACTRIIDDPREPRTQRAEAYSYRGILRMEGDDPDGAIADLTASIGLNEKPDTYYGRSTVWLEKGDTSRARQDIDEAIRRRPDFGSYYLKRGEIEAVDGDFDAALADVDDAIRFGTRHDARAGRGFILFYQGRFKSAAADFQRAIDAGGPLADVAVLFRYLARARAGEDAAAELEAGRSRLKDVADQAMADVLLGHLSPQQVRTIFGAEPQCDPEFFIAQTQLIRGTPDAKATLQTAVRVCPETNVRGIAAKADLARLTANGHAAGDVPKSTTAAAAPARGAGTADWTMCESEPDANRAVAACTRIMQDARESRVNIARAYFLRGSIYIEQGDAVRAVADYTESIRLNPNDFAPYNNRSDILRRQGDIDRALADSNIAVRLSPRDARVYYIRGRALLEKQDYDVAIADFTETVRLDPKFSVAYHDRATCWLDKRQYDRAIADFDAAIRIDPNYASSYISRGVVWFEKGDFERAIADQTAAIRLDPASALAYTNRGNAYRQQDRFDDALADHAQAIRLGPTFAPAYANRGTVWHDKGDYDRAIADFTQAITLQPASATFYGMRANAFMDKKDYDSAFADFSQAIRIDPRSTSGYRGRGNVWSMRGENDRAIADYTAALKADPNDKFAYALRGDAWRRKRDYDRAIADYSAAIRIDPSYSVAYSGRGTAWLMKDDGARSRADYDEAARLSLPTAR